MKVIVSWSGGKDSQACLIKACKDFGASHVEAVFCDTEWEHEYTYKHVHKVVEQLGVKLVILKSPMGGFADICVHNRFFPDRQKRLCTTRMKVRPMIDYVLSHNEDLLIIQGIRAAESQTRSLMSCSAKYFAEYLENDDAKRSLYRKTDVLQWCEKHRAWVERPMFAATAQYVIDYILANGQEPNPLYKCGFSRVGCFPCIFTRLSEIKYMKRFPQYVERVIQLEHEVNERRQKISEDSKPASLMPKGKIPERFCYKYGNGIPAFEDVISYVCRDDAELSLFDRDDNLSCMSMYHGLCE